MGAAGGGKGDGGGGGGVRSALGGKRTFKYPLFSANSWLMAEPIELLSDKEKEVLRLVLAGHDAKSSARELDLSIHAVNERLRSARRKLRVTSSREAARLFGQSEQSRAKTLGDKPLGLSVNAITVNKNGGRREPHVAQRPTVLVSGGILLMSLIIAASALILTMSQTSGQERSARWSQIDAASDHGSGVRNLVRLDGNSLLWNGRPISGTELKQFLEITTHMSPQPRLVLSYSAETKPARIRAVRSTIEDVLQCTPRNCQEVLLTQAR